jgi:hypothetical protein
MDTWIWIVVIAAVVIAVLLLVAVVAGRRRRSRLKQRFGTEYERTVDSADSRRRAERELHQREQRHDELELRPLTEGARQRYVERWATLQSRFVDQPQLALADADGLITDLMRDRGYPAEDFDSKRDLLSVGHGDVIEEYRAGHAIYEKTVQGTATTEDLRRGVLSYRTLYEELVDDAGTDVPARPAAPMAPSQEIGGTR